MTGLVSSKCSLCAVACVTVPVVNISIFYNTRPNVGVRRAQQTISKVITKPVIESWVCPFPVRLLEDTLDDLHYRSWYQKILAGLRFCTGNALRLELQSQRKLVNVLAEVAEKVRTGDKQKRTVINGIPPGGLLVYFYSSENCTHNFLKIWLLEDALDDLHYRSWYQKILAGLRFCTGNALRLELQSQRKLVNVLAEVAEKVRKGDKQKRTDILNKEKVLIAQYFQGGKLCSLPLNPAVVVQGVDSGECSYFISNAAPLKVSFINANPLGKNVDVICKTGDDLRRDMLVLQFVRVMNRIWLQEGLDMCMVIYRCMSTGKRTGLVEVVPDSITLATIQQERGIRGPLKDDTLKKWFHLCNKTAEDYEKALENFLHSCAGWCVVTFVLGICDRHNDNIMLKPTGHLFHIDFAKFLGHAQRFANIKRDRAPFIFTSEMHYFLTEGGRNPQRFQRFVDLCCQAYNIIRRHTQLFMSLLELMLTAGMPELKDSQDLQYVCNNLRPHESDLEATSYFTSKIKESLESVPVKLNFFIHSIAQGASIGRESKAVQPALNQTNRAIREASILGYCVKGTDILYSMQVKIEDGVLMAEKTFSQFDQLHNNLQKHFVESALPQFPSWYRLSFTPKRRIKLLNDYLKELFTGPCRGKGPGGSAPDAYVKTCLLPDPGYDTKKKTGVVKHSFNPTFNMLSFHLYIPIPIISGSIREPHTLATEAFHAKGFNDLQHKRDVPEPSVTKQIENMNRTLTATDLYASSIEYIVIIDKSLCVFSSVTMGSKVLLLLISGTLHNFSVHL
ncbi:UNVERIFIED_CONTAM: hypothetical protein FKN15_046736 [Acipenser sinensis]